ncbi:MAG: hypothetical protein HFI41_01605 [Lachnospiraceae bacterium]|nr:hypothetical protein [Lachnospiraceae bacterium]
MQNTEKWIETFIVPDPDIEQLAITEDSYPLNMALHQEDPIRLEEYGYVEEEYLVSGFANVYAWKGTTGRPRIRSEHGPYCTRILVRKPADRASFSGHVMVEMMHGGCRIDNPSVGWGSAFEHIMASGDGYVGMSIAGSTFEALKTFDPGRYGALELKNPLPPGQRGPVGNMASSPDQWEHNKGGAMEDLADQEKGLDMDIMSQVAAMIKRGRPGTPFAGYGAKYAYLIGVTFAEIPCYVSAVMPYSMLDGLRPVYDGAVIYMSGRAGNLNREEDILSWDDPRCKCGGMVPVVRIQTAGDMRGTLPHPLWACMFRSENSDEPGNLGRCYEVAGTSLKYCARGDVRTYPGSEELKKAGVEQYHQKPNPLRGTRPEGMKVSIMPHFIAGVYRNLKDWAARGIPMPKAPYLEMTCGYPDADFVYDTHGNQRGGVRTHYVDVPAAAYLEDGTILPFGPEKMQALYGTREQWLEKTAERIRQMVEERWILPEGGEALLDEARQQALSDEAWKPQPSDEAGQREYCDNEKRRE